MRLRPSPSVMIAVSLFIALSLIVKGSAEPAVNGGPLHSFGENDKGAYPLAGVVVDSLGNIFGTTNLAGAGGGGTVYELVPTFGHWKITLLHTFNTPIDGGYSRAGLIVDKTGTFYGSTSIGGISNYGTVFELKPDARIWRYTVIHAFTGGNDGGTPNGLVLMSNDRIYGISEIGGTGRNCSMGCGTVFEIKRSQRGVWTESVLYSFQGGSDGNGPVGSLIFDAIGNLYGATAGGGSNNCPMGCGTVFRLSQTSKGKWAETVLYRFSGKSDGRTPYAGVVIDKSGNLFGTTYLGGNLSCNPPNGCGTVFRLNESGEIVLHKFTGSVRDGAFPMAAVVLDAAGNLYGTADEGGGSSTCEFGCGTVYQVGRGGKLTLLHSFDGPDGASPQAPLFLSASGALYSTSFSGGSGFAGVVFELTP